VDGDEVALNAAVGYRTTRFACWSKPTPDCLLT
jgi:hypothetical protein